MNINTIGPFFKGMSDRKEIRTCGFTRATHPAAKGRWVWKWEWTLDE